MAEDVNGALNMLLSGGLKRFLFLELIVRVCSNGVKDEKYRLEMYTVWDL